MTTLKSLAELKEMAESTAQLVGVSLLLMPKGDYATFVTLINQAVDWIAQELSQNPELRRKQSEDQLTVQVVLSLKSMGFLADHDTKVGGHCDIVVKHKYELQWLAEAKIARDNPWLLKGFQQLATRYSTGNAGQNDGCLLIYCFRPRIDKVVGMWIDFLQKHIKGISVQQCPIAPSARLSVYTHERTGQPYRVRHVPISLYFNPQD